MIRNLVFTVTVVVLSAVVFVGCSSSKGEMDDIEVNWVLSNFDIKVTEFVREDTPGWIGYTPPSEYAKVEVFAVVENQSRHTLQNVRLLIDLPHDTEYVERIGCATARENELPPKKSIQTSYTNEATYSLKFKKKVPSEILEKHIKELSTVVVEWEEKGEIKRQVLFPSESSNTEITLSQCITGEP